MNRLDAGHAAQLVAQALNLRLEFMASGSALTSGPKSVYLFCAIRDYAMFQKLRGAGFDIAGKNHSEAIFEADFPHEAEELVETLLDFRIPAMDLIEGGGGEAKSTQRLRAQLNDVGWKEHSFEIEYRVDERIVQKSDSHKIDHVKPTDRGVIAFEIEWNNKDTFFDRDLANFQRLHALSAISLGAIITRGKSLQTALPEIVERCLLKHGVEDEAGLAQFKISDRTSRQRGIVQKYMKHYGIGYAEAFARQFAADKFGVSTTHWDRLDNRVQRGVGNPCPLLLIGIPDSAIEE